MSEHSSVEYQQRQRTQLRGINALLAQVQTPVGRPGQSAFLSLRRLLTLDEHIPFEMALESLTPTERSLLALIRSKPDIQLTPLDENQRLPEKACLVVQERRIGHVSMLLPKEFDTYPVAKDHFIAGFIQLSPTDFDALEAHHKADRHAFQRQGQEALEALRQMEQAGELSKVILQIRNALSHMAPFLVYVWHRIYSTFDQAEKNLLDSHPSSEAGRGILSALLQQPVASWNVEDQIFVYGAFILLQSGSPLCLEEMNSAQISVESLHVFLNKKERQYTHLLKSGPPCEWRTFTLYEKACWIAAQRSRVAVSFLRYRFIHGIAMRKEERFTEPLPSEIKASIHSRLAASIWRTFGISSLEGETREDYWQRVTQTVLVRERAFRQLQPDINDQEEMYPPIALLLWTLIQDAVEATSSDIGMSSFVRNVMKLFTAGPLSLEKSDFYCCVVPSPSLTITCQADMLSEVLRMISARMQFNRWHFIPSNISSEEIPLKRHWFYAPSTPDIAILSDQHHAGHVEASVRYTIRYPAPLTISGKPYAGAYDLRLMRQQGEPFTVAEMAICGEYVINMGYVLQALCNDVETTRQAIVIDLFDAAWYKMQIWKRWVKEPAWKE